MSLDPEHPRPKYIYKIHLPDDKSLSGVSELDRTSGFIHLSTAKQVPIVADRFFAAQSELLLQKLPLDDELKSGLKWEENDGDVFPHLYHDDLKFAIRTINGKAQVLKWMKQKDSWIDSAAGLEELE